MPMRPEFIPALDNLKALGELAWDMTTTPEAARASLLSAPAPFEVEITVDDVGIRNAEICVAARLYRPVLDKPLPAVAFFHGGGWVMGSLADYDFLCRMLARASACAVLSVDYRLAPECRYPAAVTDCYAAIHWLRNEGAAFKIDPERIAVAGDSAGANLAAAVAILVRDRQDPPLRHQLLLCPVTDVDFARISYVENAEGYLLTRKMMRWFWDQYLGAQTPENAPLAAIMRIPDFTGLAPTTLLTAEYDPLRDEGAAYAKRLAAAQVPIEYICAPGMIHGFLGFAGFIDIVEPWFDYAAARLRIAMKPPVS